MMGQKWSRIQFQRTQKYKAPGLVKRTLRHIYLFATYTFVQVRGSDTDLKPGKGAARGRRLWQRLPAEICKLKAK